MDDIDAIYAAICAQPCEDTPRLIYADALDERGSPGDADRATFIRKSIELAQIGEPRFTVENAILQERGDGYYELLANEMDGDFEVGQRVDVSGEEIDSIRHKSKNKLYSGLLVTKVIPDEDFDETGSLTLALRQDEHSVPFPKKRHAELQKFVFNEARKNWKSWTSWDRPNSGTGVVVPRTRNGRLTLLNTGARDHSGAHYPSWGFDRGFVSRVTLPWFHWEAHGDGVAKLAPVTHVTLTDAPDFDHDKNGVTIAGQLIPWSYVTSPGFGDSYDEWVEEKLTTFLSLRWPTIPPENWSIPD